MSLERVKLIRVENEDLKENFLINLFRNNDF